MSLQNPLRANEAMYSTVKGDYFYPQTVASQVIMEDGSRLNAYLGGMVIPNGMELLWENPDPNAEFAEQTLTINDLDKYKFIYIVVESGVFIFPAKPSKFDPAICQIFSEDGIYHLFKKIKGFRDISD